MSISHAAPRPLLPSTLTGAEVRFKHQFIVRLPHYAAPLKAVADLRVHLGVPEVDRITILPPGAAWCTLAPRSDDYRRALCEIRGPEAGAIRKQAFELMTADADLVEVIPCTFGTAIPALDGRL